MGKLGGQVAVITGCSTGIGLATARRFVAKGAYVSITGRRQAESDMAVERIEKNVTAVQGDVANLEASSLFRDGGSVILNGSRSSVQGLLDLSVSSAKKAAVRPFARTWMSYLKGRNIRVNALIPGPIDTRIYGSVPLPVAERFRSQTLERTPMQRWGYSRRDRESRPVSRLRQKRHRRRRALRRRGMAQV